VKKVKALIAEQDEEIAKQKERIKELEEFGKQMKTKLAY